MVLRKLTERGRQRLASRAIEESRKLYSKLVSILVSSSCEEISVRETTFQNSRANESRGKRLPVDKTRVEQIVSGQCRVDHLHIQRTILFESISVGSVLTLRATNENKFRAQILKS